MGRIAVLVFAGLLPSCGSGTDQLAAPLPVSFEDLVDDPEEWNGLEVRVRSGYLTSFEVSVLTSGFAESYPPQATQPQIWVEASAPRGPCVESAQGTTWSERVVATGTFRYQEGGGFGHLGAYDMTLQDATLSCA